MPSVITKKATRHRNGFIAIRPARSTRRTTDPEHIQTPTLTESSYTESETGSSVSEDFSSDMSPSPMSSTMDTASSYRPSSAPLPDLPMETNPFLLPPGAFSGHPSPDLMYPPLPLDAYVMGTNPHIHFDAKRRQQFMPPTRLSRPKKKGEARVIFSDEDSVISATETSSDGTATETATQASDTETERTARPTQRTPAAFEHAKSTEKPTQTKTATGKTTARSNSVPSVARALQVRRRRPNESPKPSSKRVPSKAARTDEPPMAQPDDLLSRVTSAIPDLHLLLSKYKDANGELSLHEQLRRRLETQQNEMMKSKDDTIQALMSQLEDAARESADEASRMRTTIDDLERKQSELQSQLDEAEERARVAETKMRSLEEAETRLVRVNEQHVVEKAAIVKSVNEDKNKALSRLRRQLLDDFNNQERTMRAGFEKEIEAVTKQSEAQREELETKLSGQQEQHGTEFSKQREQHSTEFSRQREELEEAAKAEKAEVETKLAEAETKLNELGTSDAEIRGKVETEWNEEKEKLSKLHEEELETLRQHHRDYCNDQIRGFVSLQERLNRALMEENESLKRLLGTAPLEAPAAIMPPPPPPVSVEDVPEDDPDDVPENDLEDVLESVLEDVAG